MFALSLCGGSILTHVFGQACAKTAAGKVAHHWPKVSVKGHVDEVIAAVKALK